MNVTVMAIILVLIVVATVVTKKVPFNASGIQPAGDK